MQLMYYPKLSLNGNVTHPILATFHVYDETGHWLGTVLARTNSEATHKADQRFGYDGWTSVAKHSNSLTAIQP